MDDLQSDFSQYTRILRFESVSLQRNPISSKPRYKSQNPLANKVLYKFNLKDTLTAYSQYDGVVYIF